MNDTFVAALLAGQSAYITGGGSGINLGIARAFVTHGARVALVGRTREKLEAAAGSLRELGGEVRVLPADVRNYADVSATLQEAAATFGGLDIVVNGAAGNFPAPALGMSANGFKAVVDIDLLGTFHVCRAAFEHLRKPGARILNVSAAQAAFAAPMQAHVCAAKSGVDMLTRTLAVEWGPSGVRVNSIWPGPIDETEGMARLAPTPEIRDALTRGIPLGRFGRIEEIAQLALFLCSPAAAYVTGAVMVCDGGQSLLGFGGFQLGAPAAG